MCAHVSVSVCGVLPHILEAKKIPCESGLKTSCENKCVQSHEEIITTSLGGLVYLTGRKICSIRVIINVKKYMFYIKSSGFSEEK